MFTNTDLVPCIEESKETRIKRALEDPFIIQRELNNRSLYEFLQCFWPVVSNDEFIPNWHIEALCEELEKIAYRVGNNQKKVYDLVANVPSGTSKTKTAFVMFPAWVWTKWFWVKLITASYSATLALESAEESRDLIRSEMFKRMYPELDIKDDKDAKSNYKVIKRSWPSGTNKVPRIEHGGNRYSTSVGGTLLGFHGHILLVDDPLNPSQAVSAVERATANRWLDRTLSTRKTDKEVSTLVLLMQRLDKEDPSGHLLAKSRKNIRHFCLPGQIRDFRNQVSPPELVKYYVDDLLDPRRMSWKVLEEMEADLGQFGFMAQVGQNPTPAGGGMFKVDMFSIIQRMPEAHEILKTVRCWDKAGTAEQRIKSASAGGAYTVGIKMHLLRNGKRLVSDVRRGRWSTEEREEIIQATTEADGRNVEVYIEQEPGSGGKESAENTIRNLAGFVCIARIPKGNKIHRADPYSVQVNNGNILLLQGEWNKEFIDEHRDFPFSRFKDQVDAAGGAFIELANKKTVEIGL